MTTLSVIPNSYTDKLRHFTVGPSKTLFCARNEEQDRAVQACLNPNFPYVVLLGPEGTGKTLLSMACAMHLKETKTNNIERVDLFRANITEEDESIGFLPGDEEAKIRPFIEPMADALVELNYQVETNKPDLLEQLERLQVGFRATGFMRGRNLIQSVAVVDEAQNLTTSQLRKLLTRPITAPLGTSRMFLCGSLQQIDLRAGRESGLPFWMKVIEAEWPGAVVHLPKSQRGNGVSSLLERAANMQAQASNETAST